MPCDGPLSARAISTLPTRIPRCAMPPAFPVPLPRRVEDDRQLPAPTLEAVMASLPSDSAFGSFEQALAHVTGPRLPTETELAMAQAFMDVLFGPRSNRIADGSHRSEFPAPRRRGPHGPPVHHAGRNGARALAPQRSGRRASRPAVDQACGCSSSRASSTSSTASTISCSCSAW